MKHKRLILALGPGSFFVWPLTTAFVLALPVLIAQASAWRITEGRITVVCPLTIGGSFQAKTNAASGTLTSSGGSPALTGAVSVDLRTLDSGIGLRNTHIRDKYLEVGKGDDYATAILSEVSIAGGDPAAFEGRTTFTGTLLLHGVKKPVAGEAQIRRNRSSAKVEATFPVTLSDFAIPKPQYLGVGVKEEIQVKVSLLVTSEGAATVEAR